MKPCIAEPRKEVGEYAPKIIQMSIDPQKIGDVVGQRGKTINAIIEQTGVKIDITDDGSVSICGTDKAMMDKAKELINIIVSEFVEGQVYVRLSASKSLVHSLSLLRAKRVWFISPRSQKSGSIM